jgi:hypothetical protein
MVSTQYAISDTLSSAPTVAYNSRTFLLNGQPEIFLSAGIHYFRVPSALWADRIARAKRGGMNTVETYVAWNFHEPAPGRYEFTGDKDLEAFITECERQGMYVIIRPGPYICAEWDYGGFPAWLQTLPDVVFRTMNPAYLNAVDRWFEQLIPIVERHQWTRGGGVVLVQVENEYANLRWTRDPNMPTDDDYQRYLRDGLIRRGIDVPLITCEGWCEGTVECVNAHHPAEKMPAQRERFPDKPLFSTEFWTAWYDAWGFPHHVRSAADLEYASWRCWAEGACGYNYYVYHGGTNFGYTPMYLQTTSYDYDAPLSETGRPTEKWRACRRVALFAQTFKEILLTGKRHGGNKATDGLRVRDISTRERGSILFVDNPDQTKTVTGSVLPYLPEITLGPRECFAYVHDVPIAQRVVGQQSQATATQPSYLSAYAGLVKSDAPVLTAHLRPDPYAGARVYVYGNIGETREVVLFYGGGWGEGVQVTFAPEPQVYEVGPSQVVALSHDLAGRTFFDADENVPVIMGPEDVLAQSESEAFVEVAPGRAHTLYALRADGAVITANVVAPALPAPPVLADWRLADEPDYTAPDFDDSDWQELEEVAVQGNMIALNIAQWGGEHGVDPYGWYRAEVNTDEPMDATLHFAACSDRLTLWLNGEKEGVSGIPPEDRRTDWPATFEVRLAAGRNVFCVLADNLGLIKGDWQIGKGQEHEKKGIYGPVTLTPSGGCFEVDIARWKFRGMDLSRPPTPINGGDKECFSSTGGGRGASPIRCYTATFSLDAPLESATPLRVRLTGMGKGVLWLNGHNLGRYWVTAGEMGRTKGFTVAPWLQQQGIRAETDNWPQVDYYLPEPYLNVGKNTLTLVETEGPEYTPERISLVWDKDAAAVVRVAL